MSPFLSAAALVIALVGSAALGFLLWRGGTGPALGYLREANTVLTTRIEEADARIVAADAEQKLLRQEIGLLEARTSLEPMVAAVIEQFAGHESRAAERHVATLNVLELIARQFGPEPNGKDN